MKKRSGIWMLMIMALASCTEVIDVDVPSSADKVVVDGLISTEPDSSYVYLTKTISYYSTSPIPEITDAQVLVNADTFYHAGHGRYVPGVTGWKGVPNTTYKLKVRYGNAEYTATSTLPPLFRIDTPFKSVYYEKEGFIRAGYTVAYRYLYASPDDYTLFRFGFKNADTKGQDSLSNMMITFDSKNARLNELLQFEIPFLRLQENDTALLIFKECDLPTYNYYLQMNSNRQGGSPFSNPPANLPTNIRGGGLGLFSAQDIRHFRVRIQP